MSNVKLVDKKPDNINSTDSVYIEGNVIIGENCKIGPNCYIRGSSSIADRCHVGQAVEIKNSILMASLYKFESKEQRRDGFFNGIILNESYVIGANRNEYLNLLSLLIFMGTIGVIGIHIFFRIRKSKNKIKED